MNGFDPHEKILLKDGAVTLYHRMDRGNPLVWQAAYKLPDGSGTKRQSTKKQDRDEATAVALKEWDELQFKARHGLAFNTKRFAAIADDYLKSVRASVDHGEYPQRHYRDHERTIERYLKPHFSSKNIDSITNADIKRFVEWRKSYWTTGPGSKLDKASYERDRKVIKRPVQKPKKLVPDHLTLEFIVLRQVFNEAVKQGAIREAQLPTLKEERKRKTKKRNNRRPAFSLEDWVKIRRHRHKFVNDGITDLNKERRALLYDYMDFLTASGIRPGNETDALCWKHVSFVKLGNKTYIQIHVPRGKTGARDVIAMPRARIPLYTIAQRRYAYIQWYEQKRGNEPLDQVDYIEHMRPEENIFGLANGAFQSEDSLRQLFETMLKQVNVVHAANGDKYTLYSCRHTYATSRLQNGTGVYGLAKNMGTSVPMIERHYGQVTTISIADELTRGA